MSSPLPFDATPLTHRRQLIADLESGGKPKERWRIGTEHEKFLFDKTTLAPVPYRGERGIATLLDELRAFKWQPVKEGDNLLALKRQGAFITLEPAGQFELSGAPLRSLHETAAELRHHLDEVGSVGNLLNIGALGIGFHPSMPREAAQWTPKERHKIMREYMPKVGTLGLDMMTRTCTVQANLDYRDEADMRKKFRVSLALQPIATALFASSPFREGRLTGDLSYRSRVWQDTDAQRSAWLDFVFESDFGYQHYIDYALSVPMYFLRRDGHFIDVAGSSFADFMKGELPARPGEVPTMADWTDHLSTLFPPVRLKKFLEMRGADMGSFAMTLALPAFWTGLLYDQTALDAADDLIRPWTSAERMQLFRTVPKAALATRFGPHKVRSIARQVLKMAELGLKNRALKNEFGEDERIYLAPLRQIVERGVTQADELVRLFCDDWNGEISLVFQACRLA